MKYNTRGENFYNRGTFSMLHCFGKKRVPFCKIKSLNMKDINQENSMIYIFKEYIPEGSDRLDVDVELTSENNKKKILNLNVYMGDYTNVTKRDPGHKRLIEISKNGKICFSMSTTEERLNITQTYPVEFKIGKEIKIIGCLIHTIEDIDPIRCDIKNLVSIEEKDLNFPVVLSQERIYIDKDRIIFSGDNLPVQFIIALLSTIFPKRSYIILDEKSEKILDYYFTKRKSHGRLIKDLNSEIASVFFIPEVINNIKTNSENFSRSSTSYFKSNSDDISNLKLNYTKIEYNTSEVFWAVVVSETVKKIDVKNKIAY